MVADITGLRWRLRGKLEKQCETKSDLLGPEANMKHQVTILNRTLPWEAGGIHNESDLKHAMAVINECENMKGMRTPGTRGQCQAINQSSDTGLIMSASEATRFRGGWQGKIHRSRSCRHPARRP